VEALLVSFGVVFVAELGDKSQLLTLAFAARHGVVPVLLGITIAAALVMGVSVVVGAVVGDALPTDAVQVLAGLAFFGVAVWTLRGDGDDDGAAKGDSTPSRSTVGAVAVAFFVAELGDKTMLATLTLASTYGPWGTWVGATLGMVAANLLAVAGGRFLRTRLPERTVRRAAAALFVVFGLVLVVDGLTG
jgi:Ca2+/H+ antiporter, TMEM165/GDT1 family